MIERSRSIASTALLVGLSCIGCGANPTPNKSNHNTGGSAGSSNDVGVAGGSGGQGGTSAQGGSSTGGTASAGTTSGGASAGGTGGSTSGGSTGNPGQAICDGITPDAAPSSTWVNATGNLANMPANCGTLGRVIAKPCSRTMVASVAGHGLWSSEDAGTTWSQLGTGAGSDALTNHAFSLFFDLEHPEVLWEAGLHTIDGGAFTSTDDGVTLKCLGALTDTQLISVDFTDPDRKTLVAGTHGQKKKVFHSTDHGENWTNIGLTLPDEASSSESPLVIDASTFLLGVCNSSQEGCGFYRTTDTGATWTKKTDLQASHFAAPLWTSDGAIYWPLQFNAGLGRSTDLGETWENIVDAGYLAGIAPIELPDGSIVAAGMDHLLRSTDQGSTWTPIGEPLPFSLAGQNGNITYSAVQKAFYVAYWDCGSSVAPDAIMSAGFDWEGE